MKYIHKGLWALGLILGSCFFEYHPYEIRLEPSVRDLNAKAIRQIQAVTPKDTLCIALIADTQRAYNALDKIVKSVNEQVYDFMLVAGDITEYGLEQEYRWIHKSLERLKQPYVTVIGNHDYQGGGLHLFYAMYGPLNDSFTHGNFNFVLHDTNSREHAFSGKVPDLNWINNALSDTKTNLVIAHVPPFSNDFDPTLETAYHQLLYDKNVLLGIYGHQHTFSLAHPYDNKVTYVVCPAPDKNFYLMLTVWASDFEIEKIYY